MKDLRRSLVEKSVFVAVCLWYGCASVVAQTTLSSVTGKVTDQSGGSVSGAQLIITNENTNAVRNFTTGTDGAFTVADLEPGLYRVRVEATGFQSLERPDLNLYPRQVVNLDLTLTVGSASETITVTSAPPTIDTETATITYTHTSEELTNLPLITRQDDTNSDFSIYNPGVARDGCGFIYANGVQGNDTTYSSDGIIEMADPDTIGNGAFIQPGLDSLADTSYVLVSPSAEYSTPTNLVLVTKGGTNKFHGNLFWEYNGAALNARNFFASAVPFNVTNDFAVSVGGPILKDKLFFFAAWNGLFESQNSVINATTALPQWRTGDFGNLLSQGIVLKNPFNGLPFPGNQIPSNMISSSSISLQTYFYPTPNYGPTGLQSGNWRGLLPLTLKFPINPLDIRIDYNIGKSDSIFGRFSMRTMPLTASINMLPPAGIFNQTWHVRQLVLSWTHTFSPNLLNEARAGVSRVAKNLDPDGQGGQILSAAGIQGVDYASLQGLEGVPQLSITGVSGTNGSIPQGLVASTTIQFIDNLSWTRGTHSMKFGLDVVRDRDDTVFYNMIQFGQFNFTGAYSGFGYADFLLGLPQTTSLTTPLPRPYERGIIWGFYGQDQWKISKRLTLNYGLRYEYAPPYIEKEGRIATFDPTTGSLVIPDNGVSHISPFAPSNIPIVTATAAGYPNPSLIQSSKTNFYPRLGVAYKLTSDGNTVIRAGYGIYGDVLYGGLITYIAGGVPFTGSESFTNQFTNGVPSLQFPNPFLSSGGTVPTTNAVGVNPPLDRPYLQQWNLVVDRQVGTLGFSAAYVGTHSAKLIYARNLDQPPPSTTPFSFSETPFPDLQSVKWLSNGGNESYNALQLSARKTAGRNLIFNAGYTFAKDLTDMNALYPVGQEIQNQYDLRAERGNSPLVPRQRFIATAVYSLPFGKGQRFLSDMPKVADYLLGGWSTSYVVTLQTGLYFTPSFDGFDPSNTNYFGGRPDVIPGVSTSPPGGRTVNEWFNPAAFKIPGCPNTDPVCSAPANVGRFGNAGVNILEGPALRNFDFGLLKNFPVRETMNLGFRVVFSNVFNHPAFGQPLSDISSTPTVGSITSTTGNYLAGSNASRKINFSLEFRF
jgi:hypothetical protein